MLCNCVVHRSRTYRNRSIVRLRQASIVQGSSIFGIKHASMTKKGPTRCKVHSRSFRLSGYSIWMAGPRRLSRWVWEQRQGSVPTCHHVTRIRQSPCFKMAEKTESRVPCAGSFKLPMWRMFGLRVSYVACKLRRCGAN